MRIAGLILAVALVLAAAVGLQVIVGAQAHPMGPMPMQMPGGMMSGQQMMSSQQRNAMMAQMQAHMAQMNSRVKAMRQQLDRINPDLLTGQERPMYEYLKLLQSHLETMNQMMGSMQGMMMQMGR